MYDLGRFGDETYFIRYADSGREVVSTPAKWYSIYTFTIPFGRWFLDNEVRVRPW